MHCVIIQYPAQKNLIPLPPAPRSTRTRPSHARRAQLVPALPQFPQPAPVIPPRAGLYLIQYVSIQSRKYIKDKMAMDILRNWHIHVVIKPLSLLIVSINVRTVPASFNASFVTSFVSRCAVALHIQLVFSCQIFFIC